MTLPFPVTIKQLFILPAINLTRLQAQVRVQLMGNDVQDIVRKDILDILIAQLQSFHAVTRIQGPGPSVVRAKCCVGAEEHVVRPEKVISDLNDLSFKTCVTREHCINIKLPEVIEVGLGNSRGYPCR